MTKYGYTILYVENVEKTVTFYINALGCKQKFITPEKDYAELDTGVTTLAFAAYSVAEFNDVRITKLNSVNTPPPFELAFITDDIENDYEKAIKAGATVITEPAQKPWGQIVAYVQDINGFLIELCTPIKTDN